MSGINQLFIRGDPADGTTLNCIFRPGNDHMLATRMSVAYHRGQVLVRTLRSLRKSVLLLLKDG